MDGFARKSQRYAPHVMAAVLLAGMLLVCGCQTASSLTLRNKTWRRGDDVKSYEKVDLTYQVNHSQSGLQKPPRPWQEARLVSAEKGESDLFEVESDTPSAISAWSKASVHVVYPHPDGNKDQAQVTLKLSRLAPGEIETSYAGAFKRAVNKRLYGTKSLLFRKGDAEQDAVTTTRASQIDDEVWTISLSKEQLDLLLAELNNNGFFGQQERPYACSELSLQIDHESVTKSWTQEPRLNQLIEHTYQQGQLVGYATPQQAEPLTTRKDKIASRFDKLPFGKKSGLADEQEVNQVNYEE